LREGWAKADEANIVRRQRKRIRAYSDDMLAFLSGEGLVGRFGRVYQRGE
jgi:hypothetical protein